MAKTSLKVISFTYYSTTHVCSCWKIDSYEPNEELFKDCCPVQSVVCDLKYRHEVNELSLQVDIT